MESCAASASGKADMAPGLYGLFCASFRYRRVEAELVEYFTVSTRDKNVTTFSNDDSRVNDGGKMPVIFLVGMRGSGKTTLGRALAARLGWLFADTDEMLCARCGKSISEIVQQEGWAGFRKRETALLHDVSRPYTVVATGGGMILKEENRRFMKETGFCCYLEAPADLLARRLRDDPKDAQRPPLKTGIETLVGGDPLRVELLALLRERDGLYKKAAHRRINVNQPLERTIEALENAVQDFVQQYHQKDSQSEASEAVK